VVAEELELHKAPVQPFAVVVALGKTLHPLSQLDGEFRRDGDGYEVRVARTVRNSMPRGAIVSLASNYPFMERCLEA
jgi:hypothetical protein